MSSTINTHETAAWYCKMYFTIHSRNLQLAQFKTIHYTGICIQLYSVYAMYVWLANRMINNVMLITKTNISQAECHHLVDTLIALVLQVSYTYDAILWFIFQRMFFRLLLIILIWMLVWKESRNLCEVVYLTSEMKSFHWGRSPRNLTLRHLHQTISISHILFTTLCYVLYSSHYFHFIFCSVLAVESETQTPHGPNVSKT